jgi:nucleoside-diphosphate-sugar epimerase
MFRRVPDLQKIKNILGWSPAHNLDQIISDTSESIKI